MPVKILVFTILSFIAGAGFIAAGIYFLGEKFVQKLNDADPEKSELSERRNAFRAKGTGLVALSVGALTLVFAAMLIVFTPIAAALALTYMILLVLAFAALVVIYR